MATSYDDPNGWDVDPIDRIRRGVEGLEKKLAAAEFSQNVGRAIEQYKATDPGYDGKLNYLLESRAKDLITMGLSDKQISQQLNQEAMGIAIIAHQQGRNPGELVAQMAENRGYRPGGQKGKAGDPWSEQGDSGGGDPWAEDSRGLSGVDPWMEGQPTLAERQAQAERNDRLNSTASSIFDEE